MAVVQIDQSVVLDRGLGAVPLEALRIDEDQVAALTEVDAVAAFKALAASDRIKLVQPELLEAINAFASPLQMATFFINAKYAELGGAAGALGGTVTAVGAAQGGAGYFRQFQKGSIYWHFLTGAHAVFGPIFARWRELGGETGFLGYPTTDVTPGADARQEGSYVHFLGGSIYWSPVTTQAGEAAPVATVASPEIVRAAAAGARPEAALPGLGAATGSAASSAAQGLAIGRLGVGALAGRVRPSAAILAALAEAVASLGPSSAGAHEVHGAIRRKYLALGAEASILGYPKTDETATPDGVGRFNHFQGGSIYWTPATSAYEVHGLIRERWASAGWERNPQLGYPISDELIPDRRIGHRRPETRKKPIVAIPNGVIKLPAEAAGAGFPDSVVNALPAAPQPPGSARPPKPMPAAPAAGAAATPRARSAGSPIGPLRSASVRPELVGMRPEVSPSVVLPDLSLPGRSPASTPAEARSSNRYSDFENGVLFWWRGSTAAHMLAPLEALADGTTLALSGAELAEAVVAKVQRQALEAPDAALASIGFVGTTGYWFDGVQVHNRRHRLQLVLTGVEMRIEKGPLGMPLPTPVAATALVELLVQVWFDASLRRIVFTLTDWALTQASSGNYAGVVTRAMHDRLDALLWSSFELVALPDTNDGKPIAVLSVKTLPNGTVAVYIEPESPEQVGSIAERFTKILTPAVIQFQQPTPRGEHA